MSAALPWLYLKGISTGDMSEASRPLLAKKPKVCRNGGEPAENAMG